MPRLAVLALLLAFAACQRAPSPPAPTGRADTLRYATAFRLLDKDEYQEIDVNGLRFALVDSGAAANVPGATVVRVPVRRIVTLSTTHLGFLARLGAADRIVGVVGAAWAYAPSVRERIAAGQIVDVGATGTPSAEAIAALNPDVVFASAGDGDPAVETLRSLGIPVVPMAEHREAHPLGRAEWLKAFGAFVGAADTARVAFDTVASRYERLAKTARTRSPRPSVLVNSPYRGTWFVPGGRTFAARQLADAGMAYVWASDTSAANLPLSLEQVLARAQTADLWLAPGAWPSLAGGAAQEPRLALFEAFRRGAVYNYDARLSPGGGFDVFETGVVQPDVVLADLVAIAHPALLPNHRLVYYRRLPVR